MKRFISLFLLISFLNATYYPAILMGQVTKEMTDRQKAAEEAREKIASKAPPAPARSIALSRSAKGVKVLWNAEAFKGATHLEIVREPAFADGSKIVKADRASYMDKDVEDGKQYTYTVSMIDTKGNKAPVKTMKAWFGSRSGTALAGERSRVEYDGFNLAFKGNEFKKHKKMTVRISPNTVEEDSLIQASELFEVTLEDEEQPAVPVTAEISYNTINMPKGYTESDMKVFLRHNAQSPWEFAKIISIDKQNKIIYAAIPHFSEIMAGFVGAPEESQTRANVNTALPKIKLQDPFVGKMRIEPPQPNISGSLHQSIPIVLPSGKAGMTPDVTLAYNSDQKNGLCGYGWALAAGDSISYIKKNGKYIYTSGAGDLIFNSAQGSISNFQLKFENSFARYSYNASSDLWTVVKDGYTNVYGESTAKLTNNLYGLSSKQWLLTQKISPDSNFIQYVYTTTAGNEKILDYIKYDSFVVQMLWGTRSDKFSYTTALGYYTMDKRLTNIQISNCVNSPGNYHLDRRYVLNYDINDVGDSLLARVELRSADNTLLSQVDMTYKTNDFAHSINTSAQNWSTNVMPSEDKQHQMAMDINGDGLQDVAVDLDGISSASIVGAYGKFNMYTNNGNGFTGIGRWKIMDHDTYSINDIPMDRVQFIDMNGDGLPDIIANLSYCSDYANIGAGYPNQAAWRVYTNTGSGFYYASNFTLATNVDPSRFSIMDMNGDGRPDYVINRTGLDGYSGVVFETYTNSGNGIVQTPVNWSSTITSDLDSIMLKAISGDGLPDLMVRNDTNIYGYSYNVWLVVKNNGHGFNDYVYNLNNNMRYSIPLTDPQFISWMDINGDGMQELVVNSNTGSIYVYRNTGTNLLSTPEVWSVPYTNTMPFYMNLQDVNGDGRPDIVVNYQNTNVMMDVYLNNGTNFTAKQTVNLRGTDPSLMSLCDIDGDGAADAVINNPDGSMTIYNGKPNFNYALNTMEANHLLISYDYSNVNSGLGFAKTVLCKTTVSNELPAGDPGCFSKDTFYTYEQGKYDRLNRIMYGFGKIAASDALSNKSVSYFSQNGEEMISRLLTNESYVGITPKLVSRSISQYISTNTAGGAKVVLLTNSVNWAFSLDGINTNVTQTEYTYYGLNSTPVNADACTNFLLYQKVSRQNMTGAGYTVNADANDDVYQQYLYTAANPSGNITPKLGSSESYMVAGTTTNRLGKTQYYFTGATDWGMIGSGDLVLKKREWNGTNGLAADRWLTSVNTYDTADHWRLTRTSAYTNDTVLMNTADYFYDAGKRFVTGTSNTYVNSTDTNVETSWSVLEPVWGLTLQVTNNNSQVSSFRYDKWNRVIAVYAPGDYFVAGISQTNWTDIGSFTNTYNDCASTLYVYGEGNNNTTYSKALKRVNRNDNGFTPFIESIGFVDGLGRTLQTKMSHQTISGNKDYVVSGRIDYDLMARATNSYDPIESTETLETYHQYTTEAVNPVSTVYDDLGRTITVSKGHSWDPITISNVYIGFYTNVTYDPLTNIRETVKDDHGRVKTIIDYTNKVRQAANQYATIDYFYDIKGNLTNTRDVNGNNIAVTYDYLGRKIAMHDPDMSNWTYTYDDLGRLVATTDAKGQVSRQVYDVAGRLIQKNYDGSTAPSVSYVYGTNALLNENGRLISVSDGSGSETYAYNERGEVTNTVKTIDGTNYITTSTFDALGRVSIMTYPHVQGDGESDIVRLRYSYQPYSGLLDKIEQVDILTNVTATYLSGIDYDAMGRRTSVTYGNGVTTSYTYDNVKSMLSSCNIANSQETLKNINYTFDKMGNLLVKNDTLEATTHYGYDSLYRLTNTSFTPLDSGLTGSDYIQTNSYDALGNILCKDVSSGTTGNRGYTYAPGRPHAVTGFTGKYLADNSAAYSMTYDANGNMTNETIVYNDGTQKTAAKVFTWDGANRLSALAWNGDSWAYTYDHTGERVKKVKNLSDATVYVNGLAQLRNGNKVLAVFDGINRIASINTVSGTSTTFYMHTDHVGSVTLITKDDGTAYRKVIYKSFGEIYQIWKDGIWNAPSSGDLANIGSYAFTGQELDSETGLYYYGARYYDAFIGRFISADTHVQDIYNTQAYGRYTYCMNNPIIYSDPSGHDWWNFWESVAAVVVAVVVVAVVAAVCVVTAGAAAVGIAGLLGASAASAASIGAGAAIGAGIGAAVGGLVGAYQGYQSGGWGGMLGGALVGGFIGGAVGGITGGITSWASPLISSSIGSSIGGLAGDIASGAITGAVAGATGYTANWAVNNAVGYATGDTALESQWNWADFGGSILGGALLGGLISGATSTHLSDYLNGTETFDGQSLVSQGGANENYKPTKSPLDIQGAEKEPKPSNTGASTDKVEGWKNMDGDVLSDKAYRDNIAKAHCHLKDDFIDHTLEFIGHEGEKKVVQNIFKFLINDVAGGVAGFIMDKNIMY